LTAFLSSLGSSVSDCRVYVLTPAPALGSRVFYSSVYVPSFGEIVLSPCSIPLTFYGLLFSSIFFGDILDLRSIAIPSLAFWSTFERSLIFIPSSIKFDYWI
jgi:hypothetical protein